MPSSATNSLVNSSLDKLSQLGYQYNSDEAEKNRKALLIEAQNLCRILEAPQEAVTRMAWVEPTTHVVIRTAIELNIFAYIKSGEPISSGDISKLTGAERPLVVRILNHLSATGIVSQPVADLYSSTSVSKMLTDAGQRDAIPWIQEGIQPVFSVLPEYLKDNEYKDTTGDGRNGPFQKAFGTELHMFEWLKEKPELHTKYKNQLAGYGEQGRLYWTDIYPVLERASLESSDSSSEDQALFVDMGGNLGRDALFFRRRFPDLKGRVICQDLPDVITSAKSVASQDVEMVPHDFFTPQPVQNAAIYFLHFVLHDWSNDDCVRILRRIRDAMGPKSKIIVNELVIPEDPEKLKGMEVATSLDWIVMAAHAARERTEAGWKALIEEAGLLIGGIWMGSGGEEAVIEAIVRED